MLAHFYDNITNVLAIAQIATFLTEFDHSMLVHPKDDTKTKIAPENLLQALFWNYAFSYIFGKLLRRAFQRYKTH